MKKILIIISMFLAYASVANVHNDIELLKISDALDPIHEEMVAVHESARSAEEEYIRNFEEFAIKEILELNHTTANYSSGHLTRGKGVYWFGNQKETYYNLNMSTIVKVAHSRGISGEYWVRSDGCKMLGDYIILACNRSVHPYGSIVRTSLGLGISLDTGSFAKGNSNAVDIATTW